MAGHLRLIAFCAGLLASAGCSDERRLPAEPGPAAPTGPTAPSPPQPSSDPQRRAALALFESASLHEALTTSPITWATEDGKVWTDGPCAFGSGSLQGSLDGNLPPTKGTFLPTGSHTYVVSFSDCLVAWYGVGLSGVASTAYDAAEWSNLTATVSAESMRGQGLASGQFSDLHDVRADGSAVWTRTGSSTKTTIYTPAPGSRLVNNSTTNVATFGGGSYSMIHHPGRVERRFDNLKVAINGTEYTLNGSFNYMSGSSGSPQYTGEIRIINNGTLVARIYGDVRNALTIEVLVPLVPL